MTVTLNCRADFTLDHCRRVAWGGEAVLLGETAMRTIASARKAFMAMIENPDISI